MSWRRYQRKVNGRFGRRATIKCSKCETVIELGIFSTAKWSEDAFLKILLFTSVKVAMKNNTSPFKHILFLIFIKPT